MSATDGPGQRVSAERLLVGYLIVAWGLLVRAIQRMFGVSPEGSTLLTLIVIGAVARNVRRTLAKPGTTVRKARSSPHFASHTMIATAVFKESVDGIAGGASRETPFAAALIVFAVVAHFFRPALAGCVGLLRESVSAIVGLGLRLRAWFTARASMITVRSRDVVAGAAGRDPAAQPDRATNGEG